MLSTILLILVIAAAVAGIVYFVHREAHRDCSCGCAACALAKNCKRASLCIIAFLVATSSMGVNVEHHCNHCHCASHAACAHHHDKGSCAHCDHCSDCYFVRLDLGQYDLSHGVDMPRPEMHLLCFALHTLLLSEALPLHIATAMWSTPHAPPHGGRHILSRISKLSL